MLHCLLCLREDPGQELVPQDNEHEAHREACYLPELVPGCREFHGEMFLLKDVRHHHQVADDEDEEEHGHPVNSPVDCENSDRRIDVPMRHKRVSDERSDE